MAEEIELKDLNADSKGRNYEIFVEEEVRIYFFLKQNTTILEGP
jgi:hypothetical protein